MSSHQLHASWLAAFAALTACADAPSDPIDQEPESAAVEAARARGILYQRLNEAQKPEIAVAFPGGRVVPVREVSGSLMPGSGPGPGQMAISADGKRLAFVSFEGGEGRLIARPLRGTAADEVILAHGLSFGVRAAWSPDGTQLAYVGHSSPNDTVMLVPATGGTPRVIASVSTIAAGSCLAPSWSPDGKELAFTLNFKVSTYRLRDGAITDVVPAGGDILCEAQWSPDGKTIAYANAFGEHPGILRVARTGGAVSVVAAGGSRARWSPDSSQLAYVSSGDSSVLHIIRADGHDDRVLADAVSPNFFDAPQFLGDGKTVLFERRDDADERLLTVSTRGGGPADLGVEDAIPGMTYAVPLPVGAASFDE